MYATRTGPTGGAPSSPPVDRPIKVSKNDYCPCENGRKFKKCCMPPDGAPGGAG